MILVPTLMSAPSVGEVVARFMPLHITKAFASCLDWKQLRAARAQRVRKAFERCFERSNGGSTTNTVRLTTDPPLSAGSPLSWCEQDYWHISCVSGHARPPSKAQGDCSYFHKPYREGLT